MTVYLVNQYFPPHTAPTGRVAWDLAEALSRRGHFVRVFCAEGTAQGLQNVVINRCWAIKTGSALQKVLHYVTFCVSLALRFLSLRDRPSVMVTMTTPPFLGA